MAKRWNRLETWLALGAIAVGTVIAVVLGVHAYVTATATPIHPDAVRIVSAGDGEVGPAWQASAARAREIVRAGIAAQNLPGVSVAVGTRQGVVWAEGFGWANLERQVPVRPDMPFRIGTASTVLTAAAVGLLLEEGRLSLDEEIQAYVPEYPKKEWPITLRQVLAHTAGIPSGGGDEGPLYGEHCDRPVEALAEFGDRDLWFQPGTRYEFSSYGWILVSAAIESASNESFHRYMRERVFQPLGMTHTRADASPEDNSGRATPYFPRYAADPRYGPDPMRDVDYSCYAGASVFLSTPSDLVRFGLAVTAGRLLREETRRLLQTGQRTSTGEETGYGLGWDLDTMTLDGTPVRIVGHDGDLLGGTAASFLIVPDRELVVAVIANTSYADTPGLARRLAEVFATAAAPLPETR